MSEQAKPFIGQEAAISTPGNWSTSYAFDYWVIKVTPSGQVVVRRASDGYERRFDKHGYEVGGSKWHCPSICYNVEELRKAEVIKTRARTAAAAIMAVRVERCEGTYSKEAMEAQLVELEQKLAVAKTAVANIYQGE